MPSLVLFDLDDTLFDRRSSASAALDVWLDARGVASTPELIALWFAIETVHYTKSASGQISFEEERRRRIRDFLPAVRLSVPQQDALLDQEFAVFYRCYVDSWRSFEDVAPALDLLTTRGIRIAVLTNGRVENQNAKIRSIGLESRFSSVLTSEQLGVAKPSPEAFAAACSFLDAVPSDVLHVGDNYELDVVAARSAGLRAVHLDRHSAGPAEEIDRIASLDDLGRYLDIVK